MAQRMQVEVRVLEGPSTLAPFAAVVGEFARPFDSPIPASVLKSLLADLLPSAFNEGLALPQHDVHFETLAAAAASALQDLAGTCGLPEAVQRTDGGGCRIVLGYCDTEATRYALHAGLDIAGAIFARAHGGPDRKAEIAALIERSGNLMRSRQPDFIARSLMRAARKRSIPFYPVSPGSRIWLYGQGKFGRHFFEAASHHDSFTGARLARDKYLSNQLVLRLGLPGVRHAIARDAQAAARIAAELGFPVVVKPIDRGKGIGVTANITTPDELNEAFARASGQTARGVLVERHVRGDDHRITVFGGRYARAVRRSPPRVVGDGRHTVGELVERESERRSAAEVAAGFVKRLTVDADMLAMLAKQGLQPEDRPESGRVLQLRSIANLATGGTLTDCSASVHPDNRELAEAIARCFHMDALGIDFMTPDIAKSWREVECAVLEVNSTPGFSSDDRAEIILREAFPPGTDGRIPSVVLIGGTAPVAKRVAGFLEGAGLCVGRTDSAGTKLAGHPRCLDARSLPARVLALLLDARCEALVVEAAPAELEQFGFPLDRCDVALIGAGAPVGEPLRRLISDCAAATVAGVSEANFAETILPLLQAMPDAAGSGR